MRRLHLLLVVALAAFTLTSTTAAGADMTDPPTTSSSKGLPGTPSASSATADSVRAFDGDRATSWTADAAGEAWIKLDLGKEHSLSAVRSSFGSSRLWSFVVEGSADDRTWLSLADRRTGLVGNHFALDVSGRYRYVRLRVTGAEGNVPASVREFAIHGSSEVDLALGRTATTSSRLAGYEAGKAIDGDSATYWVAGNHLPEQWLTVDLGASRPITAVEQHFKDVDWVNFTILGSNDNSSFKELARHTPPQNEPRTVRGQTYRLPVSGTYRFVQLKVSAIEHGHWVGSTAFRVLGAPADAAERDLAVGVVAKSSSVIDNQTPAKAVDGDSATRWVAADEQNDSWLLVDLGNAAKVHKIQQQFAGAADWTFAIQASSDNSTWATITSGRKSGQLFEFPVDGVWRYFKLTVTGKSSAGQSASSQAFRVFGNGSPVTTRWWMDHGPAMRYYPKHYRQTLNSITAGLDDLKRKGYQSIELLAPYEGPWTPWAGLGATNNYAIDPSIGTMADFERLIATAHAKGIRVTMFGNPGYSSPEAPSFKKAEADPNSPERKWFDFVPAPNGQASCVSKDGIGYFYSSTANACYYVRWRAPHDVTGAMVNLPAHNFANQEWREETAKILRFWMDKGLDGFGADAPRAYRNVTTEIEKRYITDVLSAYDVWMLPEGLQPGELTNGIPDMHYNVIHDLSINHWGCNLPGCSRIIPAIDNRNPSGLEDLFKQTRDVVNQQGGITITMPSWELDLTDGQVDPAKRVPADKRLLEIGTLATMGSQFMLHYGFHKYLPHEQTIPSWTSAQQERLYQLLRTQTNNAALQPRGLRVKLRTNDDNKYYAYKRTGRNGGSTAVVVTNYQSTAQDITVDLSNLGIATNQTPVNQLTGEAAPPINGTSYRLRLEPYEVKVLDVAPAVPQQPLADGRYRIRAEVSGVNGALDVADCRTEDGADVRIWAWIPTSPCQTWAVKKVAEPDVYTIADGNTGKVLDIAGCSTADRTSVILWPYAGRDCQQWRIKPLGDGAWQVVGVGSNKSLDVAGCSPDQGADVIIWPYHGGSCQRWYFDS